MDTTVRFAESDQDVVAIHGFLCVTMGPLLPGPIDPKNSAVEVWRVVNRECALMATRNGLLIGTLGIVKNQFWWGEGQEFLANRWFAAIPGTNAGKLLLKDGLLFAKGLNLELHIYDETKGRLSIFNKNPNRKTVNPLLAPPPVQPTHDASLTTH